jgi:hypothetical protein
MARIGTTTKSKISATAFSKATTKKKTIRPWLVRRAPDKGGSLTRKTDSFGLVGLREWSGIDGLCTLIYVPSITVATRRALELLLFPGVAS